MSTVQDSFKTIHACPLTPPPPAPPRPSPPPPAPPRPRPAAACFRNAPTIFSCYRRNGDGLERKEACSACICQVAYRGTKFKGRRSRIPVVETGISPIKTPLGMAASCLVSQMLPSTPSLWAMTWNLGLKRWLAIGFLYLRILGSPE